MPERPVDLRSDTVTRPSVAMRRAMAEAEVGDDAYGEDPTVEALERTYAELVGKDAGLFVPSGTMANQLALRVLARAGTTVLCGRSSHIASFEGAAAGMNSGAQLVTLDDADGCVAPTDVAWHAQAAAHHWAQPSLVCVENTAMFAGGVPLEPARLAAVADHGLPVHMDGARLFNAVVATGTSAADYARPCVTVWTALTKGLGAPVGSVLAGPGEVIEEARVQRQRMGGQLRQAGVLAAAGLLALAQNVDRLADDHARARRLAEAVAARWPGMVDPATVRTNIVRFPHDRPEELFVHLAERGVLAGTVGPGLVRLVTHLDIDDAGIDRACAALAEAP
ncbi:MAG: aromatic amino acid beta-eliminating lyase/threonine aldolase [Actinomycetia bacterium]|nr:aromatic amino acid beta-eliminating lyase/threonine aldolase [Actinomycetes bacterium]